MSYVELKHLLADLALDAIGDPARVSRVAVAAACAREASRGSDGSAPALTRGECLTRAAVLAAPLGSRPEPRDIGHLERAGLLEGDVDVVRLAARFAPYYEYAERQLSRLLDALAALRREAGSGGTEQAVRVAAILFNAGLFFECHEWTEALWKKETGASRELFHGLVQVAAAFYHHEKGNHHGRRALLARGRGRLASYPATYLGLELERFRKELAAWAEHFDGGPRPAAFPRLTSAPNTKGSSAGVTGLRWRG
ncbi:MAG: DUF309 domain-containing protein [Armatimonadota bacterium]|nr:DUF309 domain-containing protein [Armatimonadota bacterium]MDR7450670.1 DUF309 domain-containing protein [Armatimonadota bacterium]MDR7466026.1 DUF309 domain-containing protein [Armatimonadota bacterium]MDR7493937.1 DUF309 domain-containing protein [Armatimonadota bacterium]MDR7504042.1 DUF309 domain-containing protein [Armatimonadota bacterium]